MNERTERENIEGVQKHFAGIKRKSQAEFERWNKAGDAEKANAWYKLLANSMLMHAQATEDLLHLFPEHSGVVTRGGGGSGR